MIGRMLVGWERWVFAAGMFVAIAAFAIACFGLGESWGYESTEKACLSQLQAVASGKQAPDVTGYKMHDVCFWKGQELMCAVFYLDPEKAIIRDDSIYAVQPDGTIFYQAEIYQVSVCRTDCNVK
jgi:hypothetical protein